MKETENKSISLLNQFTQENIPNLLKQVQEQIAAIKKNFPKEKIITASLDKFGRVDQIKSVGILVSAFAAIKEHQKAYDSAYDDLKSELPDNYKKPAQKINGHSPNEWLEFIKSRLGEVANENKIEALQKFEKILKDNLSVKDKLEQELAAAASFLKGTFETE